LTIAARAASVLKPIGTNLVDLVDVYIRRLREKVDAGFNPKLLMLFISLKVIGLATYREIYEQIRREHTYRPKHASARQYSLSEAEEMVLHETQIYPKTLLTFDHPGQ
jgi:hypothetical protein